MQELLSKQKATTFRAAVPVMVSALLVCDSTPCSVAPTSALPTRVPTRGGGPGARRQAPQGTACSPY